MRACPSQGQCQDTVLSNQIGGLRDSSRPVKMRQCSSHRHGWPNFFRELFPQSTSTSRLSATRGSLIDNQLFGNTEQFEMRGAGELRAILTITTWM